MHVDAPHWNAVPRRPPTYEVGELRVKLGHQRMQFLVKSSQVVLVVRFVACLSIPDRALLVSLETTDARPGVRLA